MNGLMLDESLNFLTITGTIFFLPVCVTVSFYCSLSLSKVRFMGAAWTIWADLARSLPISLVCFLQSFRIVAPYFFSMIICLSNSLSGDPSTPGLKWAQKIYPSFELANSMLPLKPHVRSVTPILNMSRITANGLFMNGFQRDIVESMDASATTLQHERVDL